MTKRVAQFDMESGRRIATYPSLSMAAGSVRGSTGPISRCCRGKLETAYGYRWRFLRRSREAFEVVAPEQVGRRRDG